MRRAAGTVDPTAGKPAGDAPAQAPQQAPTPETTTRRIRFLDGLLAGVVLLFAFLTALFPVYNSDFFLHAATGRLLAHGEYHFGVDPFAFTTTGVYWVNHSWLYDLLLYLIHPDDSSTAGGAVLIVLKALTIAALAEVMLRAASQPGRSLWIPAVCVGLAVLVLSPRLLLQPTCFSYFCLGLTYWLLRLPRQLQARAAQTQSPTPRRPFLPYWLIPPLCLLWVNLDAWFLLGPAMVALYLIGEVLQYWLGHAVSESREGEAAPARGEIRTLLLVLAASVAACLVNPHHVWAFTLPSELGLSEAANAVSKDAQYDAPLFLTPFDPRYLHPGFLSIAGLAYYPLALLGAASFAAAIWAGRLRWPRVVVWAAFFALSAWHARAIPFFAVVAGPIAALNFLDFAVRRFGAAPASGRARTWALGGRVLTFLAGAALAAAACSGWLQSTPDYRRVGCTVEPNRGLKEMAEQIAAWGKDGLIETDGHWFNTSPDVLHYLAWYCPGQRGFLDQRLSLYDRAAADYIAIRGSLSPAAAEPAAEDPAYRKAFRIRDAHYLIWSGAVGLPIANTSPLWRLFASPKEWPLLYLNGHTAVFGWRDPALTKDARDNPFARIEHDADPDRAAFGPGAEPAPAGPTPAPRPREWWEDLWTSEPPRPPEADEAAAQLLRFEALRPTWQASNEPKWNTAWNDLRRNLQIDGAVACLGPGGGYNAFQVEAVSRTLTSLSNRAPPMPSFPRKQGEEQLYAVARAQFDFGPPSALYLSVRAARRALALRPNDVSTYEALAQAYLTMEEQTRDGYEGQVLGLPSLLRQVQIAAALRRAVALDPDREFARRLSFRFYGDMGFLDLAAQQDAEILRIWRQEGVPEDRLKPLADEVDQLKKAVQRQRDTYELRAAGKSNMDKVGAALELHLGGEALELLEKTDWNALDKNDPNKILGVERELNLLLRTGRAEEVAKTLADDEASLKDSLGIDPDSRLPAYEWLRVEAAAATGDYAEADRWLKALQDKTSHSPALDQLLRVLGVIGKAPAGAGADTPSLAAFLVGHLVLREAPLAVGAVWLLPYTRFTLLNAANGEIAGLLAWQCDLETLRGWLALEAGRIADAPVSGAARDRASPGALPFRYRPMAEAWLERLDAAK